MKTFKQHLLERTEFVDTAQSGVHTATKGMTYPENIQVWQNPSHSEFIAALNKSVWGHLRGIYMDQTDDLWIWDGYKAVHRDMGKLLGLNVEDDTPLLYLKSKELAYSTFDGIDQWADSIASSPRIKTIYNNNVPKPFYSQDPFD